MQFYWLTLAILAVWRVTHFLNAEDGPFDLVVRLRRLAGAGIPGRLMDCFYCLSVWIAAPVAYWIGHGAKEICFLWLAISAGAILLERLTAREQPAAYFEEGEHEDELLREETGKLGR